jgi:hypothetical protein
MNTDIYTELHTYLHIYIYIYINNLSITRGGALGFTTGSQRISFESMNVALEVIK